MANLTISTLNNAIIASAMLDSWGGECINHTDKDVPYGVGVSTGENIFGGDSDSFQNSGYMYIDNINQNEFFCEQLVNINIFERKDEDTNKDYQTAININHYLKRRKYDVEFSLNKNVKCNHCYFVTLTVKLKVYPEC